MHRNNSTLRPFASLSVGLAMALLFSSTAHAQGFHPTQLIGKNNAQVSKVLGRPVEAVKSSVNSTIVYARFNVPGLVYTHFWYPYETGIVSKIQVALLAKPGETKEDVLKRFGLT